MFVKDLRKEFYDQLIGHRVLIFVNYDVDAICATKIICNLFQYDRIQYTIVPVSDLNDLQSAYNQRKKSVKYVLMINIGAIFDVVDFFEPEDEQVIFVADNHRPIDVYNVYRDGQLRLLMKEDDTETIPPYEQLFNEEEEEEEEDDADDDDDNQKRNSRRRFTLEELEKRKRHRQWVEERGRILFEYSQFSYFGQSTAYLFFELAWKMSKDSNELLWLTIVAVSEQLLSAKTEEAAFESTCQNLNDHLKRLNHAVDQRSGSGADEASCLQQRSITITFMKDLQLTLYRHWSLYESLRHTMSVSCKFKVWNIRGHRKLLEFLAELGMPLVQCKQKFDSMDLEFRKHCFDWVEDLAEKYELTSLIGNSFVIKKGFRGKYTSFDIAHAIKALLESPDKTLNRYDRFFEALDSLGWNSKSTLLDSGIELSIVQHVAMLKQVHDMIDMRSVSSSGPFLYCDLPESTPDLKLFVYPGCFIQLARYVLNAFVVSSKNRRVVNLPLIMVITDPARPDSGLAVGIPPLAELSTKNLFGKAFIQIGQMIKCQMEPDLYDMSIIRFPIQEKSKLFESLVSLLS